MRISTIYFERKHLSQTVLYVFIAFIWTISTFWSTELNAQYFNTTSSKVFVSGNDTLVSYAAVPGLAPSAKFTIKVRSAATNSEWVDVFAHYTYNRALEIPDINMVSGSNAGSNSSTSVQHYPNATAGWSQTYGNIEMSRNQPIEVEIATINGFKIDGQDIYKATVHPAHKASAATIVNGKIYFTITEPVQVAIDINGQMDDHNAFVNPVGTPTDGVSSHTIPLHTITLFTNPVMKKPTLNGSRVHYVNPGSMPTTNYSSYDTLYFKPGIHNIGLGLKIYPGKAVYIPGDAILYGTINNWGVPLGGYTKVGEKITIFGYGTISGEKHAHPYYVLNPVDVDHKGIAIDNPLNYKILGVTVANPTNFSVYTPSGVGGFLSYVKVIGWRANGDGLGNGDNVNDCFVRTNDDCSYVRGNRKRVTYWKDNISGIFYMSAIWETTPILIEDCDILYCRSRGGGGAAWDMRGDAPSGQRPAQATFRNIRFHDVHCNMEIFNLEACNDAGTAGGSYNWIKFENIKIATCSKKQNLTGCTAAPWNGGLTFDNVTFAGTLLTQGNFSTYFNTNSYVNNIIFKSRTSYNITVSVNGGTGGTVKGGGSYAQGEAITVSALPAAGYKFVNWTESGVSVSTNLSYNFTISAARTLVANFIATLSSEEIPWTESFTMADGATSDGAPSSWTATGFRVLANEIAFNTVGTDGVFTSNPINISSGPVTISVNVRGGSGLDVGQDFLKLYKKVDGGAEVQIAAADGSLAAATWTANITSGSSLVLVLRAHVTAATEYYYFDDISVNIAQYTITASAGANGAISPSGNVLVNSGSNKSFTITPNSGYGVDVVTVDGVSQGAIPTYTFNNVTTAHTISATFKTVSLSPVTALTGWVSGTTNAKVAGSERLMVVMVMGESTGDFAATAVTYGGQAMTFKAEKLYYEGTGSRTYAAMFILKESGVNAATSGTIAVTWSATPSAGSSIYSVLLGNVDQSTAVPSTATNGLTGTVISTPYSLATASGDMIMMCGATAANLTQTFNNGFTKQFESNSSWGDGVGGYKLGTGVNETPSFTQSTSGRMAICAMVVRKSSTLKSAFVATNTIETTNTSENTIRVYPNPVSKTLYVNHADAQNMTNIKIFNLQGQILYNKQASGSITAVDVKELKITGLIIVQVSSGQDTSTFKVSVAK